MVAPLLIPIALEIAKIAAPALVKRLSGSDNAAAVAERVVDVAMQATGAAQPNDVVQRAQADPAAFAALQVRLAELDAGLDAEYLKDRQDARSTEVRLADLGRQSERKNYMVMIDAGGLALCLGSMVLLGWYKAQYPDAINDGVFGALMAQLSTFTSFFGLCLRDAHQYEFGSSRGSERKDILAAGGK